MRLVRTLLGFAVAAALTVLAAGCGGGGGGGATPAACFEGAGAYAKALAAAPDEVRVGGESLISECLTQNQEAGELAQVGEAMITAATRLNAEARQDPGGQAGLELGYLLGAAKRGSKETEGIHSDLLRRLEVAAQFNPGTGRPLPPEFRDAYGRGFTAGLQGG